MDKQRCRFSLSAWRPSPGVRAAAAVIWLAFVNLVSASAAPVPWDRPPTYPAWWFQREVVRRFDGTNAFPSWQNGDYPTPDDYAAANIGQLKQMASTAATELNANLPGGAGSAINGLINQWNQPPPPGGARDDFGVLNVGQLKSVAKLFYDRLIAVHCLDSYPWTGANADDYAAANVGQLKNLFSFDVALDTNGDGLPDWWELYSYGTLDLNLSDPDGLLDNRSILEAFQAGLVPDFFHGALPILTVVSGNQQIGGLGASLPAPLVIQVTNSAGHPVGHAPVTVAITNGLLSASGDQASAATTIRINADANGLATVTVFAPNFETGFTVTATAWSGGQSTSITASGTASAGAGAPWGPNPAEITPPPRPIANIAQPDCLLQQVIGSSVNTAFRQYTNDPQPVKWYVTEIADSTSHNEGTIVSTDSSVNGDKVNSTGTYHGETRKIPIFRGITYSGHSEFHSNSTYFGYNEIVDATADEAIDGTWTGSKTTNGNTVPITSPPYPDLEWPVLTLPTSIISSHSETDTGITMTISATRILQDEYTMGQFVNDILDIGNSSDWNRAIPFIAGTPISSRFIASDGSWGVIVKGSYKFTNPQQFSDPQLDYAWYEVFIPDDPTHAMVFSAPITWENVGAATDSGIHTIDPVSQEENGSWYLARLVILERSSYPACQWRNTVGAGEWVDVFLGGLPSSATDGMTWNATGGTISPSGSVATFRAGTTAGPAVITATLANGRPFSVTLTVKIPKTITEHIGGPDFKPGELRGWNPHWAGAGMRVAITVEPTDVSFSGLKIRELPGPASSVTGWAQLDNTGHDPTGGTGQADWFTIWDNNVVVPLDFCYYFHAPVFPAFPLPYGPAGGSITWQIPYVFRLSTDDQGNGVPFEQTPTAIQILHIDENGTATVTKHGAGTNPVSAGPRPWTNK